MKRAAILIAAALLASASISADGWAPIATSAQGSWDIRTSTAKRERTPAGEVFSAVVRRSYSADGQPASNLYVASLPGRHCAAGQGKLTLSTLSTPASATTEASWRTNDTRAAAVIARAVCAAVAGSLR